MNATRNATYAPLPGSQAGPSSAAEDVGAYISEAKAELGHRPVLVSLFASFDEGFLAIMTAFSLSEKRL